MVKNIFHNHRLLPSIFKSYFCQDQGLAGPEPGLFLITFFCCSQYELRTAQLTFILIKFRKEKLPVFKAKGSICKCSPLKIYYPHHFLRSCPPITVPLTHCTLFPLGLALCFFCLDYPTHLFHFEKVQWLFVCVQSCPTLCEPMDCSPPGSSVNGVFQARIVVWFIISFSRGSSQTRNWSNLCLLHWQADSLPLHQKFFMSQETFYVLSPMKMPPSLKFTLFVLLDCIDCHNIHLHHYIGTPSHDLSLYLCLCIPSYIAHCIAGNWFSKMYPSP